MFEKVDYKFKDFIDELLNHYKSPRAFLFLVFFRICTILLKNKVPFFLMIPFICLHKLLNNFFLGLDIPYNAKISGGIKIFHPIGIVIHGDFFIGRNLTIRQNTTIGSIGKIPAVSSMICENVDIGANSIIIGDDIIISKNVIIGAGTLVNKSIPENSVVVGPGFRILK